VRSLARPSAGYGSYRRGATELPAEIPAGVSVTIYVYILIDRYSLHRNAGEGEGDDGSDSASDWTDDDEDSNEDDEVSND